MRNRHTTPDKYTRQCPTLPLTVEGSIDHSSSPGVQAIPSLGFSKSPNGRVVPYSIMEDDIEPGFQYKNCQHYKVTPGWIASNLGFLANDNTLVQLSSDEVIPVVMSPEIIPNFKPVYNRLSELELSNQVDPIQFRPMSSCPSVWFVVRDLMGLPSLCKQILRFMPALNRAARHGSGTKTLRELANGHLLTQFGILATAHDLRKLYEQLVRLPKLVDMMHNAETGKVYTSRFTPTGKILKVERFTAPLFAQGPLATYEIEERFDDSSCFRFKVKCPELNSFISRLSLFGEAFGVADPAAIWDVVPFSFIVDWFLGVGNWLTENRPRLFKAHYVMIDSMFASKRTRKFYLIDHLTLSPFGVGMGGGLFRESPARRLVCTESWFVRGVAPHGLKSITVRGPTPEHIDGRVVITASLLAQRIGYYGKVKRYVMHARNVKDIAKGRLLRRLRTAAKAVRSWRGRTK